MLRTALPRMQLKKASTITFMTTVVSGLELVPYEAPSWARGKILKVPKHRYQIANLPTPVYEIKKLFPIIEELGIKLLIKRDDSTGGVELGGNKVRKLEFLLAEAIENGHDSIVTIGGEQSNHCRATAASARMMGLEPHLILRSKKADKGDLGYVGNILVDRMVGSQIYTCTPGEYGRLGSTELVARVCRHLESQGKRPYAIPVGGSNGLGTWGYIQAVAELEAQLGDSGRIDHLFFACGSGGTATGIALGTALSMPKTKVHAVGVCDDPDYFYEFVKGIALEMSFDCDEEYLRSIMNVIQGKGLGYAVSTSEELEIVRQFALQTGVVLDPVYSGKALYQMLNEIKDKPDEYRGKTVLLWHTGGALGLYDKVDELQSSLEKASPCQRLDIYGKERGIDISSL